MGGFFYVFEGRQRCFVALTKIAHLDPFTIASIESLREEDLGYMELFTSRLGKLQDTLGAKVFHLILEDLGEAVESKSYIERLNKLESLGILPEVAWWQYLRKLCNILVHEYPDNPAFIVDNLNVAYVQAKRLMTFWEELSQRYVVSW